jgi:hypothetical protein
MGKADQLLQAEDFTLPGMRRGGKLSFSLRKSAITPRHCSDEADGINPKEVLRNQRDYIVTGKDSKTKATLARARPRWDGEKLRAHVT